VTYLPLEFDTIPSLYYSDSYRVALTSTSIGPTMIDIVDTFVGIQKFSRQWEWEDSGKSS